MATIGTFISPCSIIAIPSSLCKGNAKAVSLLKGQAKNLCVKLTPVIRPKHAIQIIPCASSSPMPTANDSHSRIKGAPSKVIYGDHRDDLLNVFIDESTGIVCYRTEHGEVVCEGIDEGPHFYPPSGSNFYMPDTRASAILPYFGEGMYEI